MIAATNVDPRRQMIGEKNVTMIVISLKSSRIRRNAAKQVKGDC